MLPVVGYISPPPRRPDNWPKKWAFWRRWHLWSDGQLVFRRLTLVRTPWFSVMLNRYTGAPERDCAGGVLQHTHPWSFLSLVLRGGYMEWRGYGPARLVRWLNLVPKDIFHSVAARAGTVTLVITGRQHGAPRHARFLSV